MDIILEACKRTISQIHQPSFQYADKILKKWNQNGVKTLSDIEKLDLQRKKDQEREDRVAWLWEKIIQATQEIV